MDNRSEQQQLSFNYTEFPETLYDLKDVCYIHGCRKKKHERLVLGHRPGLDSNFSDKVVEPQDFKEAAVYLAQENVIDLVVQYDRELTKDSQTIIEQHREFFEGLNDVQQIVVIGHSMSPVDWDYFFKIHEIVPNAFWYFGCFGLNDLNNINQLVRNLGLQNYRLFRTDIIWTEPNNSDEKKSVKQCVPAVKDYSAGSIRVTVEQNCILKIDEDVEVVCPNATKNVVVLDDHIFVVLNDLDETILLFKRTNGRWVFVDELQSFEHQNLLNRRLKHVYLDSSYITFVYNNRIRRYDLNTCEMVLNRQVKDAKSRIYKGEDVVKLFMSTNM